MAENDDIEGQVPVPSSALRFKVPLLVVFAGLVIVLAVTVTVVVSYLFYSNSNDTLDTITATLRGIAMQEVVTQINDMVKTQSQIVEVIANQGEIGNYLYSVPWQEPADWWGNARNYMMQLYTSNNNNREVLSTGVWRNNTDVLMFAETLSPIYKDISTINSTTGAKVFVTAPVVYSFANGSQFIEINHTGINYFGEVGVMKYPFDNFTDPYILAPALATSTGEGVWGSILYLAKVEEYALTLFNKPLYTSVPGEPPYLIHYISLTLRLLGVFLSGVTVTPNNVLAIMESTGQLLATNTNLSDYQSSNGARYYAASSPNPVVSAMGTFLTTLPPSDLLGNITTSFTANGSDYFLSTQYISDPNGLSWVLTLTIPKTDLWGSLDSTRKQAILVATCVSVGIIAASIIATYFVTRPLKILGINMEQATTFDFRCLEVDKSVRQTSLFLEIEKMETDFYTMLEEFADGVQTSHQLHTGGYMRSKTTDAAIPSSTQETTSSASSR
ncbi:hypothetical protein BDK51DRAFT_28647 [Blyttiomyces helicus]|uniref:Cache domain-containing protein n=1 Tax=Blyttiomyces helicus TaxID=388810 RepID=A0A4P9W8X3_9FUNG|nr:hypothetical protein BDK51DRAFT_28647 [Blyttiomyces helicus]|eukprot:RKO87548.1 hypothetical protein BDK51DRAFT_28647 [Blyttiomyces helicus]